MVFASPGGFNLQSNQPGAHTTLLQQLSQATNAFSSAMTELGVQNQATIFTASVFRRTFNKRGALWTPDNEALTP